MVTGGQCLVSDAVANVRDRDQGRWRMSTDQSHAGAQLRLGSLAHNMSIHCALAHRKPGQWSELVVKTVNQIFLGVIELISR